MKHLLSVLASLATAGATIGLSVTAVLCAAFTYPWFSKGLINAYSLSAEQMQTNYDQIIRYTVFPWFSELKLTALPMSADGFQHFADAKGVFQVFIQGGLLCLILAIVMGRVLWRKRHSASFLASGGIVALAVPVLLAIPLLIDFNASFLAFHKIFFSNDLWMFDPQKDPIIIYLPEWLFMRNAYAILGILIVLSVGEIIIARVVSKAGKTSASSRLSVC